MALKVREFAEYIEKIAPIELKESYDNVGLSIGNREEDIKGILVALDVTLEVIEEAKEKGANLIFSHHPLLFKRPETITTDTLQGKKIIKLIENNINVYSAHTNLDSVEGGLNDIIVNLLGYRNSVIIESKSGYKGCGIGRIVQLEEETTLKEICRNIKLKLQTPFLRIAGDMYSKISKIAIINGSGQDYFEEAKNLGADLIITGDTSYHYVSDYKEMGISIIDITHFSCEWPLFQKFFDDIMEDLKGIDPDLKIYISEKAKEPYSVY